MEITIDNSTWVVIDKEKGVFELSFIGTNGESIKIANIKKKHINGLKKDLVQILK